MRIVLLGPPGSGKGTQAVRLSRSLMAPHVATGDLFRAEMASGSDLGVLARSYISQGNLVPDEVVDRMVAMRLRREDCTRFVLDGYPRSVEQASALEEMLERLDRNLQAAIHLDVPDDVIVERAVGRVVCSQCDAIYHLKSKPPRLMGVCDSCRGVLVVRDDDRPSTVRHRLMIYNRITAPVMRFYETRGLLHSVPGVGSADEVESRVAAELNGL